MSSGHDTMDRWYDMAMPDITAGHASQATIDLACSVAGRHVQEGKITPSGIALLKKHDPAKLQLELNLE